MKKKLLKGFFRPLTVLNKLLPKNQKLIFFYSNLGFRDNVKAFYDYLIREHYNETYRIVVSVNDYKDFLKKAPENVVFVGNKRGIVTFLRARYAFYCFGKYPIKPSKKQMVINLWHGTPLKKIGNLEQGLEKEDYNFFTKVLTASPIHKRVMADIFGCHYDQVEIMGNPRNDELFCPNNIVDMAIRRGSQKVFLWLPTYREYDDDFVVPVLTREELKPFNDYLKDVGARLIIKMHPLQKAQTKALKFPYIDFISEEQLKKQDMTVYTLLRNADALITDYSSVFFDYMLLDRPVAFVIEDMDVYGKKRGFIFDNPKEYMPGRKLKNISDIKIFIKDTLLGVDEFQTQRKELNDKINYYKDGNSSSRIAKSFLK